MSDGKMFAEYLRLSTKVKELTLEVETLKQQKNDILELCENGVPKVASADFFEFVGTVRVILGVKE